MVHFRRQFRLITLSPRRRHSCNTDVSVRHTCPISLTDSYAVSRGPILPRRLLAACMDRRRADSPLVCPFCVSLLHHASRSPVSSRPLPPEQQSRLASGASLPRSAQVAVISHGHGRMASATQPGQALAAELDSLYSPLSRVS